MLFDVSMEAFSCNSGNSQVCKRVLMFSLNFWRTDRRGKWDKAIEWAEFQFHRLNMIEIFDWIAISTQFFYTWATFLIRFEDFFVPYESRKFAFLTSFAFQINWAVLRYNLSTCHFQSDLRFKDFAERSVLFPKCFHLFISFDALSNVSIEMEWSLVD